MVGDELHAAAIAERTAILVFPTECLDRRNTFPDRVFIAAGENGKIACLRLLACAGQRAIEQCVSRLREDIARGFLVRDAEGTGFHHDAGRRRRCRYFLRDGAKGMRARQGTDDHMGLFGDFSRRSHRFDPVGTRRLDRTGGQIEPVNGKTAFDKVTCHGTPHYPQPDNACGSVHPFIPSGSRRRTAIARRRS